MCVPLVLWRHSSLYTFYILTVITDSTIQKQTKVSRMKWGKSTRSDYDTLDEKQLGYILVPYPVLLRARL